ncbi:MAG: hypothetical protein NVS3B14_08870 [Ktedonobacteraceae bacterium]
MLNPLQTWMKACDLFIGAGGYNTLAEVITTGVNALIVPRQLNEQEQTMHATRLADMRVIRLTSLDTILPENISPLVERSLVEPYPDKTYGELATDGAMENARLLAALLP